MRRPVLALSLGDPAGIGPEVAAKALRDPALRRAADFVLCGLPQSLVFGVQGVDWVQVRSGPIPRRRPSAASGRVAAASVLAAADLVRRGRAQALVTAPLSKQALHLAGLRHAGHTEMLAQHAGLAPDKVGMLLCGGGLRVFLATRHLALRRAIGRLNPAMLRNAVRLCGEGLRRDFGIARPRLALAALNPHAGEAGAFGNEERRVLAPVVRAFAHGRRFRLAGPLPADTVFVKALRGAFDAVVCLYHDQGLIPLKLLAFESGVNVTLGLPYIRTSPDHGTAYDIAGRGRADPSSMKAAIRLALDLARRRGRA